MNSLPGETYGLVFPNLPDLENPPYVSYGRRHYETCAHHVENTFNAKRAYIIASTTLSKNTNEVEKLKQALGDRLAGVRIGISPHTPWDEVIETTKDALQKKADCLITIGGGSIIDAAKAMLLFMANNIVTLPDLTQFGKKLRFTQQDMGQHAAEIDCIAPTIPLICIPTTLSGGEYTQYAGGTDPETHFKLVMGHPFCGPRLVICDPKVTITTPEWVWLSTGVRGVDHAVECFCRMHKTDESVDEAALVAFRLIVPSLLITKKDCENEDARLKCLLGVAQSLFMLKKGILGGGASHGIGHQLGPLGVGHGQTSCILLPSVMKWNVTANREKQERLKKVMWSEPAVAEVLRARGLQEDVVSNFPTWRTTKYLHQKHVVSDQNNASQSITEEKNDAGDALDAIFRELGMPRSLKEVGVGRDKFDGLSVNSLRDACCEVNPIPLVKESQVLEILEMCAG